MLEEKSAYLSDFPMRIRIVKIDKYPLHYHRDMELIYVLQGRITLKCGSSVYEMKSGDIFTINESEVHGLFDASPNNVVALTQLDNDAFARTFPNMYTYVFRTLTKNSSNTKLTLLRQYLLQIIYNALRKESGYKEHNVYLMGELIVFLEKNFNYFYFEGKTVMQKDEEKEEMIQRLSRIINYIYEHHAEKITLEDLSKEEYLSAFYISHLIKTGTGVNFRDFLCFARVECSEAILLGTNQKIRSIAEDVGFSTAAYYRKYFKKWYRYTPEEYRKVYQKHIRGIAAEKMFELDTVTALELIINRTQALSSIYPDSRTTRLCRLDINLDSAKENIGVIHAGAIITCSLDQWDFMRNHRMDILETLRQSGNTVRIIEKEERQFQKNQTPNFFWDSICAIPYIIQRTLSSETRRIELNSLIDNAEPKGLLKGQNGIFTSGLIPKPSYYAYRILSYMEGEILEYNRQYIITRKTNAQNQIIELFGIFGYVDEGLEEKFEKGATLRETASIINSFEDSMNISMKIGGLNGSYQITMYTFDAQKSLLNTALQDNFCREPMTLEDDEVIRWLSAPAIETVNNYISGDVNLEMSIKGRTLKCVRVFRKTI